MKFKAKCNFGPALFGYLGQRSVLLIEHPSARVHRTEMLAYAKSPPPPYPARDDATQRRKRQPCSYNPPTARSVRLTKTEKAMTLPVLTPMKIDATRERGDVVPVDPDEKRCKTQEGRCCRPSAEGIASSSTSITTLYLR